MSNTRLLLRRLKFLSGLESVSINHPFNLLKVICIPIYLGQGNVSIEPAAMFHRQRARRRDAQYFFVPGGWIVHYGAAPLGRPWPELEGGRNADNTTASAAAVAAKWLLSHTHSLNTH